MSDIFFPASLKPIVSKGYSYSRGSNIYRNTVQGGLPRQGRDTYFEPVPIEVNLVTSALGNQVFQSFLNNIHGGADSFNMTLDTGLGLQVHQVIIASDIGINSSDGINWNISFTATAERTAIQEDTCLTANLPDLYGCYGDCLGYFLTEYGTAQTTFPRIWSNEGPAGYPPIDMLASVMDSRIEYTGPSVNYLNSSGLLVPSAANEWPVMYIGGVAVGRVPPENAATNVVLQSSDLTNAVWLKSNTTITATAGLTPSSTFKHTPTTTNITHILTQNLTDSYTASDKYTFSYIAKNGGYNFARLRAADEAGLLGDCLVNLTTGALTAGGAGSTSVSLGNGYWRITETVTIKAAGATALKFQSQVFDNSSAATFAGDGTSSILVCGMQIEKGDFATSPVLTTTAAITRAASSARVFMRDATSLKITYSDGATTTVAAVNRYAQIPQADSAWGSKYITRIDFIV